MIDVASPLPHSPGLMIKRALFCTVRHPLFKRAGEQVYTEIQIAERQANWQSVAGVSPAI